MQQNLKYKAHKGSSQGGGNKNEIEDLKFQIDKLNLNLAKQVYKISEFNSEKEDLKKRILGKTFISKTINCCPSE